MAEDDPSPTAARPGALRGIDPTWRELDTEFATLLLRAPCEAVAEALRKRKDVGRTLQDLRSGPVGLGLDDWQRAVFVFQLDGHDWTQVWGADWWLAGADVAASLSRRLRTSAFQHVGEGVYEGVSTHRLFVAGRQVEDPREPEDAAAELGLFVAHGVWGDEDGRVVCMKDWNQTALRGAFLLLLKE